MSQDEQLRNQLREVYNLYRTVRLNCKYYGHRLELYKKINLALECTLAITTSSTIGAWAMWKTGPGVYVWAIIAGVSAILAVMKPILHLPKEIERYSKLWAGYNSLNYDLQHIVSQISVVHTFTEEMEKLLLDAHKRTRELVPSDDPKPTRKLALKYHHEVNKEIPPETLWMPLKIPKLKTL